MSLVKNSTLYGIATAINGIAAFIILPIYSKYLTTEEYGIISAMEVLAGILTIFSIVSIDRAAQRFYFEEKLGNEEIISTFFWGSLISASILCVILFFSENILSFMFPSIPFYPFFTLCIAFVFLDSLTKIPLMYLQVSEKAKIFLFATLFKTAIFLGVMYYLIVHFKYGAEGQMIGRLIVSFSFFVILAAVSRKVIHFQFDVKLFKRGLSYSWPFIPTLIIAWILNLSDRIFIEHYSTLHELGLYSMAYKVAMIYVLCAAPIQQAYAPQFFKNIIKTDNLGKDEFSKIKTWIVFMYIISAFCLSMISTDLVYLFLSSQYYSISPLINILVLSYLFTTVMGVTSNLYYQYHKKTIQQLVIVIIPALLNILLNFLLVPEYGMYGAALATLLSVIVLFLVHFGYAALLHDIPIRALRFLMLIFILSVSSYFLNQLSANFSMPILFLKMASLMAILFLSFIGRNKIYQYFGKIYEQKL